MVDISTAAGILVSVPKSSALATSRRELSQDVSFGVGTVGTLLVVEQSTLGNAPEVCENVMYTVVHGSPNPSRLLRVDDSVSAMLFVSIDIYLSPKKKDIFTFLYLDHREIGGSVGDGAPRGRTRDPRYGQKVETGAGAEIH